MFRRVAAAAGIVILAAAAYSAGLLRPVDDRLSDFRFGQLARAPTGRIVLVDIDPKSLDAIGTWPWPRTVHAELLDALTTLGAAEIAFDIDFSTNSTPAADLAFELALKRAGGTVILAAFNQDAEAGPGPVQVQANVPIPRFAEHAWPATVNIRPDAAGVARTFPFGGTIDGVPTVSMPAMLAGYAGALEGEFRIDFGIAAPMIDRVSAVDLLRGDVAEARVAGKKVIVGATAVELRDFFRVPVHGVVSGSMVQALSAETLIQGRALTKTGPVTAFGGLVVIALAMFALRRARWTVLLSGMALSSLAAEAAAVAVQRFWPVSVDTSAWHAAVLGFAIAAVLREIDFRRILLAISRTETRNTRALLAQVFADNFAGLVIVDQNGVIQAASRSATEILRPGPAEDWSGKPAHLLLPPTLADALASAVERCAKGEWQESGPEELAYLGAAGAERILEYVVRPSVLSGGMSKDGHALPDRIVASLTFVDVTARRQAEANLIYLARFDTLTGLPNRNHFFDTLTRILTEDLATSANRAVLFFDLDRFKNVNDTLGHDYGDLLLRAVAERVQAVMGPGDLLSRFGGDEYAVILGVGEPGVARAAEFAGELIRTIGDPFQVGGHRVLIGVSIGVASLDGGETDPLRVMKNADMALYRAKANGGNGWSVYDPGMDAGLEARRLLEVDLWEAFERDQFEVYYQPQVDLATGEVIGVEALLRWHHPARGLVSPAEFVPVAEATGLIEHLGAWVLRRACAAAAGWPRPIKVAVNVSPVQFTRGNLVATAASVLRETGLPPGQLELEITESLYINERRVVQDAIHAIHALGVSFAIDDFGTGYSSLSYIRKFPVQKLKIDRSFVVGLPFQKDSVAIVGAVAALAQRLEIRVNAEGIETPEQAAALRSLGCSEGQGYLYGKPQSTASITRLLTQAGPEQRLSA